MIEQDAARGVETITLPVNPGYRMRVNLGRGVRASRLKHGRFALRRWSGAKHFRTRCLIKPGLRPAAADGFEQPHRAEASDVTCVFGNIEADFHMALCCEMVQLVRCKAVDQIQNPLGGRQVPMMQEELHIGMVGILVDVVDAFRQAAKNALAAG